MALNLRASPYAAHAEAEGMLPQHHGERAANGNGSTVETAENLLRNLVAIRQRHAFDFKSMTAATSSSSRGNLEGAVTPEPASPPTGVTPVASVIDTDPQDFVEGVGSGDTRRPVSLYESQFTRR